MTVNVDELWMTLGSCDAPLSQGSINTDRQPPTAMTPVTSDPDMTANNPDDTTSYPQPWSENRCCNSLSDIRLMRCFRLYPQNAQAYHPYDYSKIF